MDAAVSDVERVAPADRRAEGAWVRLAGGREYLVPALNFKALRELGPHIDKLGAGGIPQIDQLDIVAKAAHASLARNYPDMTLAQVEEMVDLSNFRGLFKALMNVSGLVSERAPAGE